MSSGIVRTSWERCSIKTKKHVFFCPILSSLSCSIYAPILNTLRRKKTLKFPCHLAERMRETERQGWRFYFRKKRHPCLLIAPPSHDETQGMCHHTYGTPNPTAQQTWGSAAHLFQISDRARTTNQPHPGKVSFSLPLPGVCLCCDCMHTWWGKGTCTAGQDGERRDRKAGVREREWWK